MVTQKGYSFVEAVIYLSIVGILLSAALPALRDLKNATQARSAANLLMARLHQARASSVMSKKTVTLCAGTETCDQGFHWQQNILMFEDNNDNGRREPDDQLLYQEPVGEGLVWRWASFRQKPYLQFEPDGTTFALNGTFTLCQSGSPTYQVIVNLTGRARAQRASGDMNLC